MNESRGTNVAVIKKYYFKVVDPPRIPHGGITAGTGRQNIPGMTDCIKKAVLAYCPELSFFIY